jgi:hypothetical protein
MASLRGNLILTACLPVKCAVELTEPEKKTLQRLCQLVEAEEERWQERAPSEGVGRILSDFGDVAPRNESRRELFAIE